MPFTQFAPGYPLFIAGLSRFGLSLETAGYLISAIGFLLSIWLIEDTGTLAGRPSLAGFCFCPALDRTPPRGFYTSSMILTGNRFLQPPLLGMVALVVRDLRAEGKRPRPAGGYRRAHGGSRICPAVLRAVPDSAYPVIYALALVAATRRSIAGGRWEACARWARS